MMQTKLVLSGDPKSTGRTAPPGATVGQHIRLYVEGMESIRTPKVHMSAFPLNLLSSFANAPRSNGIMSCE